MSTARKIWVFGDSFSTPFSKFEKEWCPIVTNYLDTKESMPMCYGEILSAKLGLTLKNESWSGASNQTIFHNVINFIDSIKEEDIVIIGWSHVERFRVSKLGNWWYDVKITDTEGKISKHLDGVFEQDALSQLIVNRYTNDIFFTEATDYIKIINKAFPNTKVYNWTWVWPTLSEDKTYEKLYYSSLSLPYRAYTTIDKETNSKFKDIHYGEVGHQELSEDLLSIMLKDK